MKNERLYTDKDIHRKKQIGIACGYLYTAFSRVYLVPFVLGFLLAYFHFLLFSFWHLFSF